MKALALVTLLAAAAAAAALAAAAEPPEYELRTSGALELRAGDRGAVSLTVAPAAGRRIDRDAPLSVRVTVTPATGLKPLKARYALADAADPRAESPRFDLAVEATTPGDYTLSADVRFWVCAKKTCRPVRETVTVPIKVLGDGG